MDLSGNALDLPWPPLDHLAFDANGFFGRRIGEISCQNRFPMEPGDEVQRSEPGDILAEPLCDHRDSQLFCVEVRT
jgi:hypothetical protein